MIPMTEDWALGMLFPIFMEEKDLGVLVVICPNMSKQTAQWPRKPVASWLVLEIVLPAGPEGYSPSVRSSDMATPQVLCSVLSLSL